MDHQFIGSAGYMTNGTHTTPIQRYVDDFVFDMMPQEDDSCNITVSTEDDREQQLQSFHKIISISFTLNVGPFSLPVGVHSGLRHQLLQHVQPAGRVWADPGPGVYGDHR